MYIYRNPTKVIATINFTGATNADALVNVAIPVAGLVNDAVKGFKVDDEITRWQNYLRTKGVFIRKRFSTKAFAIIGIVMASLIVISNIIKFINGQ